MTRQQERREVRPDVEKVASMVGEEVMPVRRCPFYYIAATGQLYYHRNGTSWAKKRKSVLHTNGYRIATLRNFESKFTTYLVHRLALEAWAGPPPDPNMECAHLDGSRTNCDIGNLSWVYPIDNAFHRKIHGTEAFGANRHNSKLKDEDVRWIRGEHGRRLSAREIAGKFGISATYVAAIRNNRVWQWLKQEDAQ